MPDPIFAPIASQAITDSLNAVQQLLAEARTKGANEGRRAVDYLRAIAAAVQGLEKEAADLLSQAQGTDWTDPDARKKFLERCNYYLDVDSLRTELSSALEGLNASCAALVNQAGARLQRPDTRNKRKKAVEEVQKTLDYYRWYFQSLAINPAGLSGVSGAELEQIRHTVRERGEISGEEINNLFPEGSNKRLGPEAIGKIEGLVVQVEDAFT